MNKIPFLALALLAAACASHETKDEVPVTDRSAAATPAPSSASANTTSGVTQPVIAGNPLHDPSNILAQRSIYFDFDSNMVKDQFVPVVQAHSRFIASHDEARARIEGNCDERGSREYNLALGQRRAESVKRQMVVLGAKDRQIETVSYGEEKPVGNGHDEASWSQNRRDDIRYTVE